MKMRSTNIGFVPWLELYGNGPSTSIYTEQRGSGDEVIAVFPTVLERWTNHTKLKCDMHGCILLFSLFSMTHLGNTNNVVLLRCRLLINMTSGAKLSYYRGYTKR